MERYEATPLALFFLFWQLCPMWRTILLYAFGLAFAAGALQWLEHRYVLRSFSTESYVAIIAAAFVALGLWAGMRLTPRPAAPGFARNEAAIRSLGLSQRECEILELLASGQSIKELARTLGISPNTVKTHVGRIYEKLGARNRVQAIEAARALALIPPHASPDRMKGTKIGQSPFWAIAGGTFLVAIWANAPPTEGESGMPNKAVPMFHVPDVAATTQWYTSMGFDLLATGDEDGEMVWARLAWGDGELMLSAGGSPSDAERREVDLYVEVEDLEAARRNLSSDTEIVEDVHDTFYGMREFIIRDRNRFWVTFGQPIATSR
jgi:DNA-binding CsgD family transcriptional regulator/uncharacterized glyoxalase superfamily protein PhnB